MAKKKKSQTIEAENSAVQSTEVETSSTELTLEVSTETVAVEAAETVALQDTETADVLESAQVESGDAQISTDEITNTAAASETEAAAEVQAPTNLITDRTEMKRAIEAMIFASPKAISTKRIKSILTSNNFDVSGTEEVLAEIEQDFLGRGFELKKVASSWQFRTNPNQADVLQKLLEDRPVRLSPSALEVLAIIAYKQPVTRAEVDAVRGIDSSHLTRGLMEKNLIRSTGHAETPGRPLLFGTTPQFLEIFGLDSLDDLPSTEEFEKELAVSASDGEGTVMVGDAAEMLAGAEFHDRISGLPANPDRGSFDEVPEETHTSADFGVAERALAEEQKL